nr:hypothetical protein CFP56_59905 [Quercus suber]
MKDSTGAISSVTLDNREFTQAHRYVLFNSENIYQFREMHKSMVEDELRRGHRRISPAIIHKYHMEKFCDWFRENLRWGRDDVEGMTIDAFIISVRDLHEMDNLDDCEFIDDESTDEDDNEVENRDDE